jgi:hypothetical protein
MTREQFATVEALFHQLQQSTAEEQERVLATLEPEARLLLRGLLEAAGQEREEAAAHRAPQRFGPWETERRLARGGMGEVWVARRADGAFEARVALKLLAAPLRLGGFEERFRQEREILAGLDHPRIARLLDGGVSAEGVPYLVMELVDGAAIDQYCEQHRLTVRERVALFEQVCSAVSFAHSRLVLHRDLKPSNILVTGDRQVKLLDFGTAKLMPPDGQSPDTTGFAGRLMTPAYASPEMMLGRPLQVRSDVWSLGVILYQLLTGRLPIAAAEAVPDRMLSGEPVPRAGVQPELDAVLAQALEFDPALRYAQAEDLRADLERWRLGLPVEAQRGGWAYRAGKFLQRHRLAAGVAALFVLTIAAGAGITAYQAYLARQRYDSVRRLADSMVGELFSQVRRTPGSLEMQQTLAARVLEALEPLRKTAPGDPELECLLARAYVRLGQLQGSPYHHNLGQPQAALESLDQAARLVTSASPAAREVQSEIHSERAGVYLSLNRKEEARSEVRRALDLSRGLPVSAANAKAQMDLLGFLGDLEAGRDPEAAGRWYREALASQQQAERLGSRAVAVAPLVLTVKLGSLWLEKDPAQALAIFREGLSRFEHLPPGTQLAERRLWANLVRKESNALAALRRFPEAQARARVAVQVARELHAPDPKDQRALFDLVVALNDQAILLESAGALAECRRATAETIRLLEPLAQAAGLSSSFAANLAEVRQRAQRVGLR